MAADQSYEAFERGIEKNIQQWAHPQVSIGLKIRFKNVTLRPDRGSKMGLLTRFGPESGLKNGSFDPVWA